MVAGATGGIIAIAVAELVGLIDKSSPTLLSAVETKFVDLIGSRMKDLAVEWFGKNDKRALAAGAVIVVALLGALFGWLARRDWRRGVTMFAAFAALGAVAVLTSPTGSVLVAVVSALAALAVGAWWLWLWIGPGRLAGGSSAATATAAVTTSRGGAPNASAVEPGAAVPDPATAGSAAASRTVEPMRQPVPATTRRGFGIATGAALLGAAGLGALAARARNVAVATAARAKRALPGLAKPSDAAKLPEAPAWVGSTPGITPYVMPNDRFYRIDTAISIPVVNPDEWKLTIDGMVDKPLTFTYDELLAEPMEEHVVTLQCVSNEVGGDLVGNAVWRGVSLRSLLDRAGVKKGATQIVGESVDGWTGGFPTSALDGDRTALIAVGMNGELLPQLHGFPARLVIAGLYGYVSATKWLSRINLTTWEDFDGYWIPRGWDKTGEVTTQARIDVPAAGTQLKSGTQPIAGVAWSPLGGPSAVEVRVDEGAWKKATLAPAVSGETWVQWWVEWPAKPGEHTLEVRAFDADGKPQVAEFRDPGPSYATGYHGVIVNVS